MVRDPGALARQLAEPPLFTGDDFARTDVDDLFDDLAVVTTDPVFRGHGLPVCW